nr:MAG TPA: hypothetical protein [Caudoviricetes sp.]
MRSLRRPRLKLPRMVALAPVWPKSRAWLRNWRLPVRP